MRRILAVALLVAVAVVGAHAQTYHACLEYNNVYYDLTSNPTTTTLDRYNGATFVNRQTYAPFHLPAPGTVVWDEGVAFAATMQTRNNWLNTEQTSAATWKRNSGSGGSDSWMWYTTVNGVPNQFEFTTNKCRPATTTAAPTTTPAPSPTTCGQYGMTCSGTDSCCGGFVLMPKCIMAGQQCCIHYGAATGCNSSQTCCGSNGPGASSYAFCCNAGSTCCHAQSQTMGSSCCPTGTTCCAGASIGLCCAADEVCVPNSNTCAKVTTSAPTPVPGGAHRGCMSYNGWFYDLRSDAVGTTLDRYNGATFVNRQTYAPFHVPAAGTVVWDEGVAFAATMQTRNNWLNNEQTSAATWFQEPNTGYDRWTWSTTVNGAPVQFMFTTQACL